MLRKQRAYCDSEVGLAGSISRDCERERLVLAPEAPPDDCASEPGRVLQLVVVRASNIVLCYPMIGRSMEDERLSGKAPPIWVVYEPIQVDCPVEKALSSELDDIAKLQGHFGFLR